MLRISFLDSRRKAIWAANSVDIKKHVRWARICTERHVNLVRKVSKRKITESGAALVVCPVELARNPRAVECVRDCGGI